MKHIAGLFWIWILFSSLALTGCAETLAILDILVSDTPTHSGTVENVTFQQDSTLIQFEDGISYEVEGHPYVRPGDEKEIVKAEKGFRLE